MNITNVRRILTLAALLPLAAFAQDRTISPEVSREGYGARQHNYEFMLGGSGGSNKDLNNSFGGANLALGTYLSDTSEVLIRQAINYTNPARGSTTWNGSTLVAFDQHLLPGALRPYVGANFGGVYGDTVLDTWAAGLEAGAKFYVLPRTFIGLGAEYEWFFRHARNLSNNFSDGQFFWNVGVGYNF